MRYAIATAVALSVSGLIASTPVRAEPNQYLGAEIQSGGQCWVSTSPNDQGFWRACPRPVKPMKRKK